MNDEVIVHIDAAVKVCSTGNSGGTVLTGAGEVVSSLSQDTPQVGREVTPSQIDTGDGVRESVA